MAENQTRGRQTGNNTGRGRTRHRELLSEVTTVVTVWSGQSQHTKTITSGRTEETLFAMSAYNDGDDILAKWKLKHGGRESQEVCASASID